MIETIAAKPADPLLKIIRMLCEDPREDKIDLGVGVYRDASGVTPVMAAMKEPSGACSRRRRPRPMSARMAIWNS